MTVSHVFAFIDNVVYGMTPKYRGFSATMCLCVHLWPTWQNLPFIFAAVERTTVGKRARK